MIGRSDDRCSSYRTHLHAGRQTCPSMLSMGISIPQSGLTRETIAANAARPKSNWCSSQGKSKPMRAAMRQLHLSARAYHRVLKLARTIADLAGSEGIEAAHLAKALQYRPKEQT